MGEVEREGREGEEGYGDASELEGRRRKRVRGLTAEAERGKGGRGRRRRTRSNRSTLVVVAGRRYSQADWMRRKRFAVMRAEAIFSFRGSEVMAALGGRMRESRSRCKRKTKQRKGKKEGEEV